ncbi:hypothetical protein FNV43_RR16504 [Rhamnella rubrinervis]|uniref:Uncharacterized protein n=1 Tax=Rhamnella rubrinervis TaxID=2594499 RepID=A0A8K0GYY5_9ROSA|nr:hypothetical protein FNV43_RR16504 [Rhamnella rubrinervis]
MEEQSKAPETEEANPAPASNAGVGAAASFAIVLAIKQSIATSRTTRMWELAIGQLNAGNDNDAVRFGYEALGSVQELHKNSN